MALAEPSAAMSVTVVFSPRPGQTDESVLSLPPDSSVADAVLESGLTQRHPSLDLDRLRCAVWGVVRPRDHRLRENDRVELLRPLRVDPKEARRLRYQSQRAKR